ncbi:MAG: heparinase II/III family protein [Caulobacteraceae bacterium]
MRRRVGYEFSASGLRVSRLERQRSPNLIATPRDFRPNHPEAGRAILAGRFVLAGATLETGPGGDPWDQPSPSRAFAAHLHRFDWAPDLLACGEAGAREGLRLFLDWRRLFYRPNRFVWSGEIVERRLFNLACQAKRLTAVASDAEASILFNALVHHARFLSHLDEGPARASERFAVAALAASTLNGQPAARLTTRCLAHLARALPQTVLPDGGMRSRSPQAGLELLFDLLTLDDLLLQRGRETPVAATRAMDRLSSALRFFTLSDGRLVGFQGGEMVDGERLRAAMSQDEDESPPSRQAPHSGYHRLSGPTLQAMIDAGLPAQDAWSVAACAQPLAMAITCGPDPIFCNAGWSPEASGAANRLTAAGNTVGLDHASAGKPLTGWLADVLGPRLVDGAAIVEVRRDDNEVGSWLELAHDGWSSRYSIIHERRIYIDLAADEMRGEDAFPIAPGKNLARTVPFCVRFHVHPDVQVSIAKDGRSVLLRGPSTRGWWFRNDAAVVALEPSVHFEHGAARRSVQVVLRGEIRPGLAARVRWKLTPVEPTPPKAARIKAKAAPKPMPTTEPERVEAAELETSAAAPVPQDPVTQVETSNI